MKFALLIFANFGLTNIIDLGSIPYMNRVKLMPFVLLCVCPFFSSCVRLGRQLIEEAREYECVIVEKGIIVSHQGKLYERGRVATLKAKTPVLLSFWDSLILYTNAGEPRIFSVVNINYCEKPLYRLYDKNNDRNSYRDWKSLDIPIVHNSTITTVCPTSLSSLDFDFLMPPPHYRTTRKALYAYPIGYTTSVIIDPVLSIARGLWNVACFPIEALSELPEQSAP